ncbi:NADH dehydrogenase [ubiquinone] 1 alpha subcomplex assembly factor 8 isoform X1 [Tupaia chinensis]|uniref:NADH dehydrogenase [ubiquinone] 1 alpha subcomplex assembly factor 8 isoform X1 n=1 Tax=Tupaia chinensis TaxID=246437 RepID=UPI0007042000|nr:NADH dehydrogenase [ubiquinone] 1 alpha subcomplex assembly factor 8 isoform X1 [Tupaia chinensis]
MSARGTVWCRVRGRLRAFPEHLATCGAEAAADGRAAGLHGPGRTPEAGPLRTGVRSPAELLRCRGQEDPGGRRQLGETLGCSSHTHPRVGTSTSHYPGQPRRTS